MTTLNSSARLKLDNMLPATDLSPASKAALLYAIPIARRHEAKLFIVHVSSSESPGKQLKSLVHLGHLPKHDDRSSRAWLHGKLLVALLTQKLIRIGRDISP